MLSQVLELFGSARVTYVDAADVVEALRAAARAHRLRRWYSVGAMLPQLNQWVDVLWVNSDDFTTRMAEARILAFEGRTPVWLDRAGQRVRPTTWRDVAARHL